MKLHFTPCKQKAKEFWSARKSYWKRLAWWAICSQWNSPLDLISALTEVCWNVDGPFLVVVFHKKASRILEKERKKPLSVSQAEPNVGTSLLKSCSYLYSSLSLHIYFTFMNEKWNWLGPYQSGWAWSCAHGLEMHKEEYFEGWNYSGIYLCWVIIKYILQKVITPTTSFYTRCKKS